MKAWDLDAGTASEFELTPRSDGGILTPLGVFFDEEAIVVAGNVGRDRFTEQYSIDGTRLIRTNTTPLGVTATLMSYRASPSGTWVLERQLEREAGVAGSYSLVRTNRATGGSETLDVPVSFLAGVTASTADVASVTSSATISDDGSMVMGFGQGNSYRLLLIPVDASPGIERDRSLPPRPLGHKQTDAIRATLARTLARISPSATPSPSSEVPRASEGFTVPQFGDQFRSGALRFDTKGRLWVSTTRGSVDAPTTVFDVFSATLEHLGEVALGEEIDRVYHIGGELLVARVRSETSETVKVWRIREP